MLDLQCRIRDLMREKENLLELNRKQSKAFKETMKDYRELLRDYMKIVEKNKKLEKENETLKEELISRIRQPKNTPYGKGITELMEEKQYQHSFSDFSGYDEDNFNS